MDLRDGPLVVPDLRGSRRKHADGCVLDNENSCPGNGRGRRSPCSTNYLGSQPRSLLLLKITKACVVRPSWVGGSVPVLLESLTPRVGGRTWGLKSHQPGEQVLGCRSLTVNQGFGLSWSTKRLRMCLVTEDILIFIRLFCPLLPLSPFSFPHTEDRSSAYFIEESSEV